MPEQSRRLEAGGGPAVSGPAAQVTNGRGREFTLDDHGFTLVADARDHIDYLDEAGWPPPVIG